VHSASSFFTTRSAEELRPLTIDVGSVRGDREPREELFMLRTVAAAMIAGLMLILVSSGGAFAVQFPNCKTCNAHCSIGTCFMNSDGCECVLPDLKCLPSIQPCKSKNISPAPKKISECVPTRDAAHSRFSTTFMGGADRQINANEADFRAGEKI